MKAAVLYNPGAADQFRLEERPIPTPQNGQVLIRVKAFGLANWLCYHSSWSRCY